MAIETKTIYVADDGSYWETEVEAEVRNEEISEQSAIEIETLLSGIKFGIADINTKIENFELTKPASFEHAKSLADFTELALSNNVIRIDNASVSYIELAKKHQVSSIIMNLLDKLSKANISAGTFYKINGNWILIQELENKATEVIFNIRRVAESY